MANRPRVAISRCLLGDPVRHDGGHKHAPRLLALLADHVEWLPICPEVEVGMGTPREPIRLEQVIDGVIAGARRVRLRGVVSREDWTARMVAWTTMAVGRLADERVAGCVLKRGSPSCGTGAVPIVRSTSIEDSTSDGRGLFAQAVMDAMPGLPLVEETEIQDPATTQAFLNRVREYGRRRSSPAGPSGRGRIRRV